MCTKFIKSDNLAMVPILYIWNQDEQKQHLGGVSVMPVIWLWKYLWCYWRPCHSHCESSWGWSPGFTMEENTNFTVSHPSSQILEFPLGTPLEEFTGGHQGKHPWSAEGITWALGLCEGQKRFSWETGQLWELMQSPDSTSSGRKERHYQQHFKK